MIIPELPDYLTKLGGEDYKGLIISLFTLTAGLSRPFSGKLTDRIGRLPVMVFGAVICFISGILYPVLTSVAGFLFLRFFHGLSTGFKPTGTSAYIADIVPFHRRGEAMGVVGVFLSCGVAAGPVAGSWVAEQYTIEIMFYISSILGLMSVLILSGMKETLPEREKFRLSLLKVKKEDVFEPKVLRPSIIIMLSVFSMGIILTVIPDLSEHVGIKNKGLFFTYFTLSSIFVRIIAGKISDRYGRPVVLKFSTLLLAFSMFTIGLAESSFLFITGSVLYGLAVGINTPTLFAWTIDLSEEKLRGRAMSTMFIALEIGIGVGALLSGFLYNNDPANFKLTFWAGGVVACLAFIYLIFYPLLRQQN